MKNVVMSQAAYDETNALAKSKLVEIDANLTELRAETFASSAMVDYHYERLVGLEVRRRLWADVVASGGKWDVAFTRVGNIIRSSTVGLQSNTPRVLIELKATLSWFGDVRRRALDEGVDLHQFVWSI